MSESKSVALNNCANAVSFEKLYECENKRQTQVDIRII